MSSQYEKNEAERIRNDYSEKKHEVTKFDELKALDKKVKNPAIVFAYIFGILGTLVLGVGMCLAMEVIGHLMALGIVIGVIGIAMLIVNYYIYKIILNKRKQKYSKQIIAKSNELLND